MLTGQPIHVWGVRVVLVSSQGMAYLTLFVSQISVQMVCIVKMDLKDGLIC